jgi:hydrogenase expression/formation protein HypC
MCLAIPAKVTKIDGEMAIIDVGGVTRSTSLILLSDVAVGDYVIVHAGFAIHKVEPGEAQESLRLFRGMAAAE